MRLEIDAGNTRIKWRCVEGDEVISRGSGNVGAALAVAFEGVSWSELDVVVASSVKGEEFKFRLAELCLANAYSGEVCFVESAPVMGGVTFAYDDVSRLGVDRCLAMVAAYKRYPRGVLVIDAGSALTADFISGEGCHIGGFILPGFSMLKQALLSGTDEVNVFSESDMSMEPGASTEQCVDHGRLFLCKSLLQGLLKLAKRRGIEHVVLTGGDASILNELVGGSVACCHDLVFEGLSQVIEG